MHGLVQKKRKSRGRNYDRGALVWPLDRDLEYRCVSEYERLKIMM